MRKDIEMLNGRNEILFDCFVAHKIEQNRNKKIENKNENFVHDRLFGPMPVKMIYFDHANKRE